MKTQIPSELPDDRPKAIFPSDKKNTESTLVHLKPKPAPTPAEDLDDMWDNVPV